MAEGRRDPPETAIAVHLSVIIPARNEAATLARVVERVIATGLAGEVIVVDDGSDDDTEVVLRAISEAHPASIRILRHATPRGKGAATRTGLAACRGDIILVQDADLEYDPAEYPALLAPFADARVDAVYGSRNLRANPRSSFAYYWGGRGLSRAVNLLYGAALTDESTGFKLVRAPVMRSLGLRCDGFAFCAELTSHLLRRGCVIREVPISYRPRTHAEGKKIRWRDGIIAIAVMLRLRFARVR